jgi:hypothetical protein
LFREIVPRYAPIKKKMPLFYHIMHKWGQDRGIARGAVVAFIKESVSLSPTLSHEKDNHSIAILIVGEGADRSKRNECMQQRRTSRGT